MVKVRVWLNLPPPMLDKLHPKRVDIMYIVLTMSLDIMEEA